MRLDRLRHEDTMHGNRYHTKIIPSVILLRNWIDARAIGQHSQFSCHLVLFSFFFLFCAAFFVCQRTYDDCQTHHRQCDANHNAERSKELEKAERKKKKKLHKNSKTRVR